MNFYKSNHFKVSIFNNLSAYPYLSTHMYIKNNELYYLHPFPNRSKFLLESKVIRLSMQIAAMHLEVMMLSVLLIRGKIVKNKVLSTLITVISIQVWYYSCLFPMKVILLLINMHMVVWLASLSLLYTMHRKGAP